MNSSFDLFDNGTKVLGFKWFLTWEKGGRDNPMFDSRLSLVSLEPSEWLPPSISLFGVELLPLPVITSVLHPILPRGCDRERERVEVTRKKMWQPKSIELVMTN